MNGKTDFFLCCVKEPFNFNSGLVFPCSSYAHHEAPSAPSWLPTYLYCTMVSPSCMGISFFYVSFAGKYLNTFGSAVQVSLKLDILNWITSAGSRGRSMPDLVEISPVVWEKNQDRQTNKQTDRQTDRRTDSQTHLSVV